MRDYKPPEGVMEMLSDWREGKEIKSCMMGGLGESYEIAIHRAAMEFLRNMVMLKLDGSQWEADRKEAQKAFKRIEAKVTLPDPTISGAMYTSALNLASVFYLSGVKGALAKVAEDRRILISQTSMRVVEPTE